MESSFFRTMRSTQRRACSTVHPQCCIYTDYGELKPTLGDAFPNDDDIDESTRRTGMIFTTPFTHRHERRPRH